MLNKDIIHLNSTALKILNDFVSLIYPHYCLSCEGSLLSSENLFCTNCLLELPRTDYHIDFKNVFYKKMAVRVPVKYVMAYLKFHKDSNVQNILHNLKYKNHPEIGFALGKIYGQLILNNYAPEFDIILSVPLHVTRKRKRGYNQSEEFGKGLSAVLQIPCTDDVIIRQVRTETQTKKSKLKRWDNVSDVFKVARPDRITNKRILLVDDVITTGATLEACARALIDCGCKEISIACIAAAQ